MPSFFSLEPGYSYSAFGGCCILKTVEFSIKVKKNATLHIRLTLFSEKGESFSRGTPEVEEDKVSDDYIINSVQRAFPPSSGFEAFNCIQFAVVANG